MVRLIVERTEVKTIHDVRVGITIMDAAKIHDLDLACECGGAVICATCHVIVSPEWTDRLEPPIEAELDMLDAIEGREATSRLGCQVVLTEELDGLEVKVPRSANV
jgi:ferredoxin, 2Fe-2S